MSISDFKLNRRLCNCTVLQLDRLGCSLFPDIIGAVEAEIGGIHAVFEISSRYSILDIRIVIPGVQAFLKYTANTR